MEGLNNKISKKMDFNLQKLEINQQLSKNLIHDFLVWRSRENKALKD